MSKKRGRPRHKGARYPGGRLRPADYRSDTQIRRIVEQGLALGLDPMLGSQAGRLRLQGHLSDRHLAVIDYVGRIYGRYELYAGLHRRTRSPSYEASARDAGCGPHDEDAAAAARADFLALQRTIPHFPAEARDAIERLCVDDLHVPERHLADLIVLLERIDAELMAGRRELVPLTRRRGSVREQRFAHGAYAHREPDAKPLPPSELLGAAAEAAARDRAEIISAIEQGNARRTPGSS